MEDRLSESRSANNVLIDKLTHFQKLASKPTPTPAPARRKKSFRNFESEMEDYEPVEEEVSEEEKEEDDVEEEKEAEEEESVVSEPEIADTADMPVRPAFGEIDYYRDIEGED